MNTNNETHKIQNCFIGFAILLVVSGIIALIGEGFKDNLVALKLYSIIVAYSILCFSMVCLGGGVIRVLRARKQRI